MLSAYGGTAAACLRAAARTEIIISVEAKITCGFADLAIVQARLAAQPGVRIVAETFTATGAELVVALPEADIAAIVRMIADLTSGRAIVALPD